MSDEKPMAVVVDDNPIILIAACSILEESGFECVEAQSGDEAWSLLDRCGPRVTLLFSDVEMPGGMNGFDLARKVVETYPSIEVVLASGRVAPQPGDLPGNASFIPKPFSATIVKEHLVTKLPEDKLPLPLRAMEAGA